MGSGDGHCPGAFGLDANPVYDAIEQRDGRAETVASPDEAHSDNTQKHAHDGELVVIFGAKKNQTKEELLHEAALLVAQALGLPTDGISPATTRVSSVEQGVTEVDLFFCITQGPQTYDVDYEEVDSILELDT